MQQSFFWSPKAARADQTIIKRLENRRLKQYDRYLLEREQEEAERVRALARLQKEDSSLKSDDDHSDYKPKISTMDLRMLQSGDSDSMSSAISMHKRWKKIGVCGALCERWCIMAAQPYVLNWWEYLIFLMCLNTSIVYEMLEMQLVAKWGANLVLFNFIITEVAIGIPTFMVYMFLGNYARRSYIKFWDCVPIMKGIGYSIFCMCLLIEIFSMSCTAMCALYVYELASTKVPWLTCDFPDAHDDCIPMIGSANNSYERECCSLKDPSCTVEMAYNQSARYSTFDYYVRHMLKLDYNWRPRDDEYVHLCWKGVVVILWGLTAFLMTIGLRNYRKFCAGVSIVISTVVLLCGVVTIYASPNYTAIKGIIGKYKDMVNSEVWMDTFILTMYREVPSDVLTICAVSTPAISTTSDTVIIYAVKIAVNSLSIVWLAMACNSIQLQYNIRDSDCILIQGDLYFFAILPDKLSRMFMAHIVLIIYFIILFLWNFTVTVNILNSAMEAVLEEFQYLAKWRLVIASIICITLCGFNIPLLEHNFMQHFKTYIEATFTITVVTIIIASLTGMFLYSVQRISNDYHFSYGVKLNKYWTYGIKSSMLVFTIMAILVYIYKSREDSNATVCALILWTIPIGMVLMSLRYYMRVNTTLIDPNPQWGPPSRRRKHARMRFDPTHELKCRSLVQRCKHYCLLHSIGIRREIKHWRNKLDSCIVALNEEADADGSIDEGSDDAVSRLSTSKSRDTLNRRGSLGGESINTVNM